MIKKIVKVAITYICMAIFIWIMLSWVEVNVKHCNKKPDYCSVNFFKVVFLNNSKNVDSLQNQMNTVDKEETTIQEETTMQEETTTVSSVDNHILYMMKCVEAEAGNQTELGKRLVCDVILNRFDEGGYNTYSDVINEKNQFAVVENGYIMQVNVPDETCRIVFEELENRTNYDVMYFRTGNYHEIGNSLFKEDDHYFSGN